MPVNSDQDYIQLNKQYWDELSEIHLHSDYYNIIKFEEGHSSLKQLEIEELGCIENKEVIHLQCHIGIDSLSLARNHNALVTAIDFSERSIDIAKSIAKRNDIRCNFYCCKIGNVHKTVQQKFDVVFTSYGILAWLDDLNSWAKDISNLLKKDGFFFIIDEHPFSAMFNSEENAPLNISFPYHSDEKKPYFTNNLRSYTGEGCLLANKTQYKWGHSFSEIINSLWNAGLQVDFLKEYNKTFYRALPNMEQKEDGWWYLKSDKFPLMFSLKAHK